MSRPKVLGWLLPWVALWLGCVNRGPPPIAPQGLQPIERRQVEDWLIELALTSHRVITVRPWRFTNDKGTASGRAAIRLAPPDSMRFDYRAPLGKSGAAVLIGGKAKWMRPEGSFSRLIRVAPVFWAALGHPPFPPVGAELEGLATANERVWRYASQGDTLTFIAEGNPISRLRGEMRRDGRTFVLSQVVFDTSTYLPLEARVDFPLEPSRFSLQMRSVEIVDSLETGIWDEP